MYFRKLHRVQFLSATATNPLLGLSLFAPARGTLNDFLSCQSVKWFYVAIDSLSMMMRTEHTKLWWYQCSIHHMWTWLQTQVYCRYKYSVSVEFLSCHVYSELNNLLFFPLTISTVPTSWCDTALPGYLITPLPFRWMQSPNQGYGCT